MHEGVLQNDRGAIRNSNKHKFQLLQISVLHSKAADEALVSEFNELACDWNKKSCLFVTFQANFARWEPWHGKFGFSYPWNKYLCIRELLGELAALVLTLRECLQSHQQA